MPTVLQFRRGTTAQNDVFTGSAGEIVYNTSTGALRVHDGTTAGGNEMLLTDGSNADSTVNLTNLTASGTLTGATLDISGNADIDGTMEADAYTVNGTSLSEYIADTAGAMWSSNSESNITVTYQDADNTIDISLNNTSVTAGSYGSSTAIPTFTVDAQGRLTAAGTTAISSDMSISSDSGTGTITVGTDTFTVAGGTNINTAISGDTVTVNLDSSPTISGSLTVTGNLTVNGTTTTVSSTNTVVSDNLIELNNGASSNANDSGIVIERGSTGNNAFMGWDESADQFIVGTTTATGSSTGNLSVTASTLSVATPTASSHATTKSYVDTALSSLSSNSLSDGNSTLTLTDSGTGNMVLNLDASTHTTFNSTGIVLATGTFQGTATSAKYADLAEKYMPDSDYQPGTVLQFGGEQEVTIANEYATHRVAGVVSTDPAYMMNSDLDGGVYIALAGRVPCNVFGTCEKGDLMVTSDTDGCAVAWTESFSPPYGSVIGKALENKDTGNVGIIEVVVGVR